MNLGGMHPRELNGPSQKRDAAIDCQHDSILRDVWNHQGERIAHQERAEGHSIDSFSSQRQLQFGRGTKGDRVADGAFQVAVCHCRVGENLPRAKICSVNWPEGQNRHPHFGMRTAVQKFATEVAG